MGLRRKGDQELHVLIVRNPLRGSFSSVKVTVWRRFLDGLGGLGHVA